MIRTRVAWPLVALIALSAGCAMCAHPYDYCGPTFTGECGQVCDPMARAGSRLSPPLEPMLDETAVSREAAAGTEEKSPAAAEEQPQPTKESTGEPAPETLPEPEAKPKSEPEARSAVAPRARASAPSNVTAPNRWTARPTRPPR
jgi:hypothetical protein